MAHGPAHAQLHEVAGLHAVERGIVGCMCTCGAARMTPSGISKNPCGPISMQPGVPAMLPDWRMGTVETERDGIGEGELDLVEVAARAEDAEIGDHAAARADERDGFLRGKLILLIEPLHRRELRALAEERLDRLRGQVAMPRADVHQQGIRRQHRARGGPAQPLIEGPAHEVLDFNPMGRWRGQ
jgi:hypothetical protein